MKYASLLVFIISLFCVGCIKQLTGDNSDNNNNNNSVVLPRITYLGTSDIASNGAAITINASGGSGYAQIGIVYSKTKQSPNLDSFDCAYTDTSVYSINGTFKMGVYGLDIKTLYYAKVFVRESNGSNTVNYTPAFSFTTLGDLMIDSAFINAIYPTSATLNAQFHLINSNVSRFGFCYATTQNPDIQNTVVDTYVDQLTTKFSTEIKNLDINKTYYVRPYYYVYGTSGTSAKYVYGPQMTFKTTGNIGISGCNIIYDKGSYSDGWRYLESASTPTAKYYWGCDGTSIGQTLTDVGAGLANTNRINSICTSTSALAYAAKHYTYNGYTDWFLGSSEETLIQSKAFYQLNISTQSAYYAGTSTELTSSTIYGVGNFGKSNPYITNQPKTVSGGFYCYPLRRY